MHTWELQRRSGGRTHVPVTWVQSCCWSRAMCFTEPPTTALMTRQPVSDRLGRTRKEPCMETDSVQAPA